MSLVSVITPLYNCSNFLEQAIQSVLSQTYQDWEMIMVDDCSKDSSLQIAQRYAAQDDRIKVLKLEQNSGAALARNTAIEAAKGRYIAFLDSDDRWYPTKLEKQIAFMREKDIDFSYSAYNRISESGELIDSVGVPDKVTYNDLLKTCYIGCLTAIYNRDRLGKVYMPTNSKREDFATWLQILKMVNAAWGIDEALAEYRVYNTQSSAKKLKMAGENWRLYRDVENLNLVKSIYVFTHYAVCGLMRTRFPRLARRLRILK